MILYHLDKWKYRNVWPPEGTLHAEGRWNKQGQWVIYTSPAIALAKLEILANESNLPVKRVCMEIEVSNEVEVFTVEVNDLPDNWVAKPYPTDLVKFTEEFIKSGCLIMRIPSALSQREYNYILNVRHPNFHELVKLNEVFEEAFDTRLRKS